MAGFASRVIFKSFSDCGIYIDPKSGEVQIDSKFDVFYVDVVNKTSDRFTVQAFLDFKLTANDLQAAIVAAIVADGAARGFKVDPGDVFVPSFAKV